MEVPQGSMASPRPCPTEPPVPHLFGTCPLVRSLFLCASLLCLAQDSAGPGTTSDWFSWLSQSSQKWCFQEGLRRRRPGPQQGPLPAAGGVPVHSKHPAHPHGRWLEELASGVGPGARVKPAPLDGPWVETDTSFFLPLVALTLSASHPARSCGRCSRAAEGACWGPWPWLPASSWRSPGWRCKSGSRNTHITITLTLRYVQGTWLAGPTRAAENLIPSGQSSLCVPKARESPQPSLLTLS